jgi:hypothetical protein
VTRARVLDLVGFAAYFLVAAVLGRLTVLDGPGLPLVWPAAGVAAAWFAVTGWRRGLAVDGVVLFVCAAVVNGVTGASASLSIGLAAGNVVQVLVFGVLLSRWCPQMWGFGERPPPGIQTLRDLGSVMTAALVSAAVACLIGPTSILFEDEGDWSAVARRRVSAACTASVPVAPSRRRCSRPPRRVACGWSSA